MDPNRERTTLVVALAAALLLGGALAYTGVSAASEARSPGQLRNAAAGRSYPADRPGQRGLSPRGRSARLPRARPQRTGHRGLRDGALRPRRARPVPRRGAEVIVTVHRRGNAFVAEKDSLVTRCPSKVSDGQGRRLLVAGRACLLLALASASTAGAALCAPGVRAYRALGRPSACRAPSWGAALTEMGGSAHRGQGVQRRCSSDSGACDPAVRHNGLLPRSRRGARRRR